MQSCTSQPSSNVPRAYIPDSSVQASTSTSKQSIFVRTAIFSAVLLPVALVPYFITRRGMLMLRHQVDELQRSTTQLHRELNLTLSSLAIAKEEQKRTRALFHDIMENSDDIRQQVDIVRNNNNTCRKDIHALITGTQHMRTQAAALTALGTSLADIAGFMHEMELETGMQSLSKYSQRRVDRLRILALRLQNLSSSPQQPNAGQVSLSELLWNEN
ncbi:hypothetical protein AMATHDRAFT_139726 [Amanita thiersii Skay4041]|uniref:Uncharacterized protein n=1 Tax=Amanita thiersii Skay4041 TaxID=703135 RepID=A0A2A9NXR0_9AGAR|nr:hypothetical protein AMATHDRAFT_139726 [Amanita thiersii Skay4041]